MERLNTGLKFYFKNMEKKKTKCNPAKFTIFPIMLYNLYLFCINNEIALCRKFKFILYK